VAALFYTLFETAKLSGVNPQAFVLEAAKRAIRKPGTVTLPADLKDLPGLRFHLPQLIQGFKTG
jgi:hypothetical protein